MSEFKSKWMNFPETYKNLSDKSAKSPFVTFGTSLSERSGEKKALAAPPTVEEHDGLSLHEVYRRPPPIGYGGYDLRQVELAERQNDKMGICDAFDRSLNVWMWLVSSYLAAGDKATAIKARNEYHKLRHEDETITEACGLCEAHGISPLDSFEGRSGPTRAAESGTSGRVS